MAGLYLNCDSVVGGLFAPDAAPEGQALNWELRDAGIDAVLDVLTGMIVRLRKRLPGDAAFEVGVAIGGHVDAAGQVLTASPEFRDDGRMWSKVPLAELLRFRTGARIHLVNDANALAFADLVDGPAQGARDFVSVFINDYGVGCGMVANGRLIFGSSGSAGEIGHLQVTDSSWPCRCGGVGCLERVASMGAIEVAIANLEEEKGLPPSAARARVHREAGRALGVALAGIVTLLNPGLIVVHGPAELLDSGAVSETAFLRALADRACNRPSIFADSGSRCAVIGMPFEPEQLAAAAATYGRSRAS